MMELPQYDRGSKKLPGVRDFASARSSSTKGRARTRPALANSEADSVAVVQRVTPRMLLSDGGFGVRKGFASRLSSGRSVRSSLAERRGPARQMELSASHQANVAALSPVGV